MATSDRYIIIMQTGMTSLREHANELVKEGYEPIGGFIMLESSVPRRYDYCQTMYKPPRLKKFLRWLFCEK
jgi:hypothetical protein